MAIGHHVNRKENSMSSTKTDAAEPSRGGKGIFIALIPWIMFTVLASHATLKIGSLAALAAAIVIAGRSRAPGVPSCSRSGRWSHSSDSSRWHSWPTPRRLIGSLGMRAGSPR